MEIGWAKKYFEELIEEEEKKTGKVLSEGEFLEELKKNSQLPERLNYSGDIDHLYFHEFECEEQNTIEWEGEKSRIMFATIFKIIQKMTDSKCAIFQEITKCLFLTYRSFFTSTELFELFIFRVYSSPSPSDTQSSSLWDSNKQKSIRKQVLFAIFFWVGEYYHLDFKSNSHLLLLLAYFIKFQSLSESDNLCSQILTSIDMVFLPFLSFFSPFPPFFSPFSFFPFSSLLLSFSSLLSPFPFFSFLLSFYSAMFFISCPPPYPLLSSIFYLPHIFLPLPLSPLPCFLLYLPNIVIVYSPILLPIPLSPYPHNLLFLSSLFSPSASSTTLPLSRIKQ